MRSTRIYIIIVISVLFISNLLLPFNGFTTKSDRRDTIILLGNENLPPIVYNDNGTARGVAVDIAMAIGDKTGAADRTLYEAKGDGRNKVIV